MIWQNPWALVGLLSFGVPVLIHLLSRRRANVQKFPTLRFLDGSRVTPTRRTRLSDIPLLMVRLGILAGAVAALAQPLLLTAGRKRNLGNGVARAIIVDSSASMLRPTPNGVRALDSARAQARQLSSTAGTSVILQSVAPTRMLPGAVAWLSAQTGKHELIIESDFQIGTLDSADLAIVPSDAGIRLIRLVTTPTSAPIALSVASGADRAIAHIVPGADRTDVEWTLDRAPAVSPSNAPLLLAGTAERPRALAAEQAARSYGPTPSIAPGAGPIAPDTSRSVAIVFPEFEQRAQLVRDAKPLDRPWMAEVLSNLGRDSTLVVAASTGKIDTALSVPHAASASTDSSPFVVVARDAAGRPMVLAARGSYDGRERMLLVSEADAGSLVSASLIAAVGRAIYPAPEVSELEPSTVPEELLRRWQRPTPDAIGARATDSAGASDGRWLWVVALLLLALETWLRRARRDPPVRTLEVAHERVA